MIEYKHVALRYTDKNILKDVNLRIENGEFMVLVGPSGSGKTTMLKLINGQETSPEAQDALRASLAEKLATPVSADLLAQWMSPEVQEYVLSTGLPWFEDRLREGVVGDVRLALPSKNGIIVRDVDTKAETLRPDVSDIRDVPAVLAAFTQKLRSAEKLTPQGRRAVLVLFSPLIMPTLTLNREATQALGNAVAQTVEPVYYHIQKLSLIHI